jgi:hypothetical protein
MATMSTDPTLLITGIVAALAVVQSVFGVGMLLFGTPLLLLLGLPFPAVLTYLLPCSIAVSVLQIATTGGLTWEPIRRQFATFALPAVLVGTIVALMVGTPHETKLLVGATLLLTAMIRLGSFRSTVEGRIRAHLRPMMVGLGLLHGLSNLGGGVLAVIVGSCFVDKSAIRRHIAFGYAAMAIIQLSVVLLIDRVHIQVILVLCLPVLAGTVYLLIGQRAFRAVSQRAYQFGLTGMITCFGLVLLGTA